MSPTMVPCAVIYDLTSMVLIYKMFRQLVHCLPLQRNPDIILGNFKNHKDDSSGAGFISLTIPPIFPTPPLDIRSYGRTLEFAPNDNGLASKCPYSTILHSCYPFIICAVHFLFELHFNYTGAPIYGPYHISTLLSLSTSLFLLLAQTPQPIIKITEISLLQIFL